MKAASATAMKAAATVVFIAPTQSGKSKSIDELYALQGQPRPSASGALEIGNGKQSKTTHPTLLPAFPAFYLKSNTWEPPPGNLRTKVESLIERRRSSTDDTLKPEECEALREYRALCKRDMAWKADVQLDTQAPVYVTEQGSGQQPLHLQCLDTPGLDDSRGRDDEHMENILVALGQVESVIAFVVIAKSGQPFSDRFLKCLRRYWDQFPSFRHNWIFLHTAMDPSKTDYDEGSCYEQECEERKCLLVQGLLQVCEGDSEVLGHLPHIHVDNVVPDPRQVKTDPSLEYGLQQKMAARAQGYNSLLLAIASNRPVPVGKMAFLKSEEQQQIDATLVSCFRAYTEGLLETLHLLKHHNSQVMGKYAQSVKELQVIDIQIRLLKIMLSLIDRDKLIPDQEHNSRWPWRLLGGNDEIITIKSQMKIAHTEITCNSKHGCSGVEDLGIEACGDTFVWKVRIWSKVWCSVEAILKTYVLERDKHHQEIKRIKKQITDLEEQRSRVLTAQRDLNFDLSSVEHEMEHIQERIDFFSAQELELSANDIALPDYIKLRHFYQSASPKHKTLAHDYFAAKGQLPEFERYSSWNTRRPLLQ